MTLCSYKVFIHSACQWRSNLSFICNHSNRPHYKTCLSVCHVWATKQNKKKAQKNGNQHKRST